MCKTCAREEELHSLKLLDLYLMTWLYRIVINYLFIHSLTYESQLFTNSTLTNTCVFAYNYIIVFYQRFIYSWWMQFVEGVRVNYECSFMEKPTSLSENASSRSWNQVLCFSAHEKLDILETYGFHRAVTIRYTSVTPTRCTTEQETQENFYWDTHTDHLWWQEGQQVKLWRGGSALQHTHYLPY